MNLVFSGGHITPALALMQHAKTRGDRVIVLGKAITGAEPVEAVETRNAGFPFYAIPEWKYHRYSLWKSLQQIPQGIKAILVAYRIMAQEKSQVCVVFGGYLSLPVAIAAKLHRLPVVLHEQTMNPGVGSRMVAYLANTIFTAFPQAKFHKNSQAIGNLIRQEFYTKPEKPTWFMKTHHRLPLIYITGGNQGSRIINTLICNLYPQLAEKYTLVHQCGGTAQYHALAACQAALKTVPDHLHQNIIQKAWFPAADVAWIMSTAHILIGRAGANTVSEIMVCGVPSILIPLLSNPKTEQYQQAQLLVDQGISQMILEEDLSPNRLKEALISMENHYHNYERQRRTLQGYHQKNAVTRCYQHLITLANEKEGRHHDAPAPAPKP
jgi:UDP-N-acetylglucosamine--N-acetylmuramyl-(pentapeptide) pyrophosphoryl-undecaprenol N-acetylglucosamine transferase